MTSHASHNYSDNSTLAITGHLILIVSVWGHMCVQVHMHTCAHSCRAQKSTIRFVSETGPFIRLTSYNLLNWPTNLRDPFVSVSPVLGLHSHVPIPRPPFLMWVLGSNSGPHTCRASTLTSELSSWPLPAAFVSYNSCSSC